MFYGNSVLKQIQKPEENLSGARIIESVVFEEYKNRLAIYEACTDESERAILEVQLDVLQEISIKDIWSKIKKAIRWLLDKIKGLLSGIGKFIQNVKFAVLRKRLDYIEDKFDDFDEFEDEEDDFDSDDYSLISDRELDRYQSEIDKLKDEKEKLARDKERNADRIKKLEDELAEKKKKLAEAEKKASQNAQKASELELKNKQKDEMHKKELDAAKAATEREKEAHEKTKADNEEKMNNLGSLYNPFVKALAKAAYDECMYFKPSDYLVSDAESKAKTLADCLKDIEMNMEMTHSSSSQIESTFAKYQEIKLFKFDIKELEDTIRKELAKHEDKNSLEKATKKHLLKQYSEMLKKELDSAEDFTKKYQSILEQLKKGCQKACDIVEDSDTKYLDRAKTIAKEKGIRLSKVDRSDYELSNLEQISDIFDKVSSNISNNIKGLNIMFKYNKEKIRSIGGAIGYCSAKLGLESVWKNKDKGRDYNDKVLY
jgi:myosin heavy subunit